MAIRSSRMELPGIIETACEKLTGTSRSPAPRIIAGVTGVAAVLAVIWFLPDLIRYIKLERM